MAWPAEPVRCRPLDVRHHSERRHGDDIGHFRSGVTDLGSTIRGPVGDAELVDAELVDAFVLSRVYPLLGLGVGTAGSRSHLRC